MDETVLRAVQGETITAAQARQHNPLALAYVGDTVYDLYVHTHLLKTQAVNSHRLHVLAIGYVSAHAQAAAFRRVEHLLDEDEFSVSDGYYVWHNDFVHRMLSLIFASALTRSSGVSTPMLERFEVST